MKDIEMREVIHALKKEIPETPKHFEDTVEKVLYEQLRELPKVSVSTGKGRKRKFVPVLVAAALVLTSGGVIAGTSGKELIKKWMKIEDDETVEEFAQEGVNASVEVEKAPFDGPLWTISDVWYDGASLAFVGTATEEGLKYDTGSDHIYINGKDCLMNYYDSDDSKERNIYFCQVDIPEEDRTEKLEVEIPLKAWNKHKNPLLAGQQQITFSVDQAGHVTQMDEWAIPLENGEVVIHSFSAAVSGVDIDFTYKFSGEDAKERLLAMNYTFLVTDSKGTRGTEKSTEIGDVYQDENGNWCRHFYLEKVRGMDYEKESYTVTPQNAETNEEGKMNPATAKVCSYGIFTIQMEK